MVTKSVDARSVCGGEGSDLGGEIGVGGRGRDMRTISHEECGPCNKRAARSRQRAMQLGQMPSPRVVVQAPASPLRDTRHRWHRSTAPLARRRWLLFVVNKRGDPRYATRHLWHRSRATRSACRTRSAARRTSAASPCRRARVRTVSPRHDHDITHDRVTAICVTVRTSAASPCRRTALPSTPPTPPPPTGGRAGQCHRPPPRSSSRRRRRLARSSSRARRRRRVAAWAARGATTATRRWPPSSRPVLAMECHIRISSLNS